MPVHFFRNHLLSRLVFGKTEMEGKEKQILEHLSQFVSDHKKQFVEKVLSFRTRHLTVVLEDIYQSQNASAVLRTCECMGLQDVHIIEQLAQYEINPKVLKGSNKWMTLHRYHSKNLNNTKACFDHLKSEGYRILVADPSADGIPVNKIAPEAGKIALVFGNELRGVSAYGIDNADQRITIPMFGFTESLNISVSAAICLSTLVPLLHKAGSACFLSEDEKEAIKLSWYRRIVRRSDLIEKEFLRTIE